VQVNAVSVDSIAGLGLVGFAFAERIENPLLTCEYRLLEPAWQRRGQNAVSSCRRQVFSRLQRMAVPLTEVIR
jgi:hypothetical protein